MINKHARSRTHSLCAHGTYKQTKCHIFSSQNCTLQRKISVNWEVGGDDLKCENISVAEKCFSLFKKKKKTERKKKKKKYKKVK